MTGRLDLEQIQPSIIIQTSHPLSQALDEKVVFISSVLHDGEALCSSWMSMNVLDSPCFDSPFLPMRQPTTALTVSTEREVILATSILNSDHPSSRIVRSSILGPYQCAFEEVETLNIFPRSPAVLPCLYN